VSLLAFLRCRHFSPSMAFSAFATVFESVRGMIAALWLINDACCACCGAKHVHPIKVAARALIISGLIQIRPWEKGLRHFFDSRPRYEKLADKAFGRGIDRSQLWLMPKSES